jgi:exodeoxyribonuclease V alpha subunit
MVDLALMRRLLGAVPEDARVILLGDPDQLASVEAGGVLGDICNAAACEGSPMQGCLSRLTESHRYPAGSGIAALAAAVHQGDDQAALEVLRGKDYEDVSLVPDVMHDAGRKALALEAGRAYAPLASKPLAEKLSALSRFRVLCAHQRGPDGARAINERLASIVHGSHKALGEAYAGRPILVTQNDYGAQLFNGDVGVIAAEPGKRALKAFFLTGAGTRAVALGRLPHHESVYAMTVHKSQGSEHEHVAIVLPESPSPVVTRELLYTAITRARRFVTVYASEAVLRAAVRTRTVRASGLVAALNRGR